MNQEQLESLPYPIFETTGEEKLILRDLIDNTNYAHLCTRVADYRYKSISEACGELTRKIQGAINFCHTLEHYLDPMPDDYSFCEHGFELRNIWIRKLLAYNPE